MGDLTSKISAFLEKHKIYYFIKKEDDIVFCYKGKYIEIITKPIKKLEDINNGIKIIENFGKFAIINEYSEFLNIMRDLSLNRIEIRNFLSIEKLNKLKINRVNKEKVFSYKNYVKTIHINTERIREWDKNY